MFDEEQPSQPTDVEEVLGTDQAMSVSSASGIESMGDAPVDGTIPEEELGVEIRTLDSEMKRSYLEYAMAVIIGRALPDARDGLKPVQRRVLYTMHEDSNIHNRAHKKSANIVGACMGAYHPHGDTAIYDTMVRMAQPWQLRIPFIDGQGNWGSRDGDSAAAYRYSEARMTQAASVMLRDIDQETVDFQPNYDGRSEEPVVLPARFPNLLVNGAAGIAVGMATQIPPHNLREVVAAIGALIDDPDITTEGLMQHVIAPDLPTGGDIVGRAGIRQAYETGRGRLVMRGTSHIETRGGNRESIVVTELPYTVQKGDGRNDGSGFIRKVVQLVNDKHLSEVTDIRDESGKDVRIVIDLRQGAIAQVVRNKLHKHTPLQLSYGINMVALNHGQPQQMGLKALLRAYLDHQVEVITRRTRHQLNKARARAYVLEGLLLALSRLDEVIAIIRHSETQEAARSELTALLGLGKAQADAILSMRLGQLTSTDVGSVQREHDQLTEQISGFRALLGSEKAILDVVRDDLAEIADRYGDDRRSRIIPSEDDMATEDLIPETPSVILLTESGYLKRVPLAEFRAQVRGGKGVKGIQLADDGDRLRSARVVSTHEWVLVFTDLGRVWRLRGWQVPEASKAGKGRSLANILPLDPSERILAFCNAREFDTPGRSMVFSTRNGVIKRTRLDQYAARSSKVALKAITLADDDALVGVRIADDDQTAVVLSATGRAQRFKVREVRATGRTSAGVRAMRLADGDQIVSLSVHDEDDHLLLVSRDGYGKRVPIGEFRIRHRGGLGVRALPPGVRGEIVGGSAVRAGDELLVITASGMVQRLVCETIPAYSRGSKGVRVMRLTDGDEVQVMCLIVRLFQPSAPL